MTSRRAPDNKRLKRINGAWGHWYQLDRDYAPGVTTVLNLGFPVPFHVPSKWASRLCAEYARDNWQWFRDAPTPNVVHDVLLSIADNTRDEAANKGTILHGYGQTLLDTGEVELAEEHEWLAPVVDGYADLLDLFTLEAAHTEVVLANTDHRWCGTTDIIGRSADLAALAGAPADSLGIIDLKTGNGIRDKDFAQVEAYRRATIAHIDGAEVPMPKCEWAAVIHARPGLATVTVNRVAYHDRIYGLFQAAHTFWLALDDKRGWLDHAHTEPHEQPPTNQEIAA